MLSSRCRQSQAWLTERAGLRLAVLVGGAVLVVSETALAVEGAVMAIKGSDCVGAGAWAKGFAGESDGAMASGERAVVLVIA